MVDEKGGESGSVVVNGDCGVCVGVGVDCVVLGGGVCVDGVVW